MLRNKTIVTSALILLSSYLAAPCSTEMPSEHRINGVPRIKQLTNYCGPACVASVMQYYGAKTGQEEIGKAIYSPSERATTGADMLFYSREAGYAAYTWNSSIEDVKKKLAAGLPVIVLEYNSDWDSSGHYRVLVGYSDVSQKFFVVDPYYDKTEMSYRETEKFWRPMGFWALMIVPKSKDQFGDEMEKSNPVLHMDLSYAQLRRGNYEDAMTQANAALSLQPHNPYARSLVNQIRSAMGAGKRARK